MPGNPKEAHYFIDESGQTDLFDTTGELAIAKGDNSRFFYFGLLIPDNPNELARGLVKLRHRLRSDPYFKLIPSMSPEKRLTYRFFHAAYDCWEARYEVFKFLHDYKKLRFLACIKDKYEVLNWVQDEKYRNPGFRYSGNMLYNHTAKWLLRDHLGKSELYRVHIAKRETKDQREELTRVLIEAQKRYSERWGKDVTSQIDVQMLYPWQHAGLQAVDYFLWGLQRMYEKGKSQYVDYLRHHYRLVIDIDDKRHSPKGEYYNEANPLTIEKLTPRLNEEPEI